jgi:hypothetical protein
MTGDHVPGPLVDDAESVYRAILYPGWWADGRPSSAAFDEEVFSVDRKILTTPEETIARFKMVLRLVEFACGEAKAIGFETRAELDPRRPENKAHANVHCLGYHELGGSGRKKKARKLAGLCREVEIKP